MAIIYYKVKNMLLVYKLDSDADELYKISEMQQMSVMPICVRLPMQQMTGSKQFGNSSLCIFLHHRLPMVEVIQH